MKGKGMSMGKGMKTAMAPRPPKPPKKPGTKKA